MNRTDVILNKMIHYADKALSFVENTDKQAFVCNDEKQYAVSLALLQIGELITHLPDEYKDKNPSVPWKKIKGLRNIIVHQYGSIDEQLLWQLVLVELPVLADEIRRQVECSAD
jgi:uncharacterized protein with HEPN domain